MSSLVSSPLTLHYFPLRARAESSKLMLAYANVPYVLNTIQFKDWGTIKAAGTHAIFGQVPSVTTSNGKLISQSGVCIRYIAKVCNLVPSDEALHLDAEMMVELANELNAANPLFVYYENGSEAHAKTLAEYLPKLPGGFTSATNILNGKDFYGGSSPSYGDFAFLVLVDNILGVEPNALASYPALHAWYTRCMALPAVATYMASRPIDFCQPGSIMATKA